MSIPSGTPHQAISQLETALRLSFPVIGITTFELARAEIIVEQAARAVKKSFLKMPFRTVPSPNQIEALVNEAAKKGHNDNGAVIFDPHFSDRQKIDPETTPALRAALFKLENLGVNYVIAGREALNDEFVYHVELPAMSIAEIVDLLRVCETNVDSNGDLFTSSERNVIATHAVGLSHTQMKNVFTYCSYLKIKRLPYLNEIRREKAHILRDVGLDVLEPLDIDSVGGLENLKAFLIERAEGWKKGLPVKGVLLAGVPGGGKTLSAKAAAGALGTTLVRLDVGRFYTKYLGETERLFMRALHTIEQIAPIVVLIDEIEKFFGAGDGDHEVSKRLLGALLYWLQERNNGVFIVATANKVQALPPELMRAGRWDRSFFIDLPSPDERQKIFEIHLRKHGVALNAFKLEELVNRTDGYSGAEIEQSVVDALYVANSRHGALNQDAVLVGIERITPTSITRAQDIAAIRRLKDQGFFPANIAPVEPTTPSRKLVVNI